MDRYDIDMTISVMSRTGTATNELSKGSGKWFLIRLICIKDILSSQFCGKVMATNNNLIDIIII